MLGEPCMQDECVHWMAAWVCPDPRFPNVTEIRHDCVINLSFFALRDTARFSDQTGAAVNMLTNTIVDIGEERARLSKEEERLLENG